MHLVRSADDFADEGEMPDAQRLALLDDYDLAFAKDRTWLITTIPLVRVIGRGHSEYHIPVQLFRSPICLQTRR